MDYKLGDNSSIYVRGLYSHFDNFGDRWVLTPTINSFTTSPTQGGGDGNMSYNASIRRPLDVIGSMVAGGSHSFSSSRFTWDISVSRSAEDQHGYSSANFLPASDSPLNAVQFALDRSNPYRPKFIVQNGVNIYDTTPVSAAELRHRSWLQPAGEFAGRCLLRQAIQSGVATPERLKIGGKIRNAHKFSENDDIVYNLNDPTIAPLSMFPLKQTVTNFYNGSYTAPPAINYSSLMNFYHGNTSAFSVDPIQTL